MHVKRRKFLEISCNFNSKAFIISNVCAFSIHAVELHIKSFCILSKSKSNSQKSGYTTGKKDGHSRGPLPLHVCVCVGGCGGVWWVGV